MKVRATRILDFDIENRPLTYLGQDFTTAEITAIAWRFIGNGKTEVRCLGEYDPESMLQSFLDAYELADMVTGHNLLKHDLPIINGACLEFGLGPLPSRLVHDTYHHLRKRSRVSASQESLAEMLGIKAPKVGMSQVEWRRANRLLPEGIEHTRRRAAGDVAQHIQLRKRLLELGWLGPPRSWQP